MKEFFEKVDSEKKLADNKQECPRALDGSLES